jgi:Leucine-rich repeat (LRR) protein
LFGNRKLEDISNLKKLDNLIEINLDECNLSEIPKNITKLKNLQKLFLYHNTELKNISILSELKNLKELDITGCPVSSTDRKKLQTMLPNLKLDY